MQKFSAKLLNTFLSPNVSSVDIPVEFVVIHYTACSLRKTMDIFMNPERGVTAHFVIDTNGDIYDMGHFFNGPIKRCGHAGESQLFFMDKNITQFNHFSIGIELINHNGNIFNYTEAQYLALTELCQHLQKRFKALSSPNRFVGHEHIAGHRGKCDPGLCFDWNKLLAQLNFTTHEDIARIPVTSPSDIEFLHHEINKTTLKDENFWPNLNLMLEKKINS